MAMQVGVSRLKELLFDSEHEQLARLQNRVEQAEGINREHVQALSHVEADERPRSSAI
jgi:hypothetical protein